MKYYNPAIATFLAIVLLVVYPLAGVLLLVAIVLLQLREYNESEKHNPHSNKYEGPRK